ncbi:MAG: hypothetical protein HC825_02040 [Oscillatoriales cyanobacterium RM1_1_9]|nr:hypothetical protein [Oscillatoriales cyanobacterium SM2_3_0]NJO45430.1 hypothetical protein [Oscillatoriales cyanobacterium RM2_1_1]NJO70808.1 hypothetical protein [Oscillatoriales cyanobacterium RM1_1_9]
MIDLIPNQAMVQTKRITANLTANLGGDYWETWFITYQSLLNRLHQNKFS